MPRPRKDAGNGEPKKPSRNSDPADIERGKNTFPGTNVTGTKTPGEQNRIRGSRVLTVNISPPTPHGAKQLQIMKSLMTPGLKETWVACGVKYGKSLGAAGAMVMAAPITRGGFFRWIAPVYSQAKNIGMKYFKDCMPAQFIKINKSDLTIEIPGAGCMVQFMHGQRPEDLEGAACHGYVLDEASKLDPAVYHSARTTTTQTRGPFLNISTPRGKNWFYHGCMQAKEHMEYMISKGKQPEKIFIQARTRDNPYVPQVEIEAAKKTLPDALFRQYYEAEFVDAATTFPGLRGLVDGPEIELNGANQQVIVSDHADHSVVIGVDWAKQEDWTVFCAISYEEKPARIVGFQRFQGRSFTDAIRSLVNFAGRFKSSDLVLHDETGLGGAMSDMLSETALAYEGVTFTSVVKAEMVTKLIQTIERRWLVFPNIPVMLAEMEAYEMTATRLGGIQFSAPEGSHDDIVTALLLANIGLHRYADTGFAINMLEDLKEMKELSQLYYGDSDDDQDERFVQTVEGIWLPPNYGSGFKQ